MSEKDPFVDRVTELQMMEAWMTSPASELAILYGRRRVGKTRLLRQALATRPGTFFVADLGSSAEQLRLLTERLHVATGDPMLASPFSTWDALLHYVMSRAAVEPFVLVLDEFPYLCNSHPPLASVLTRIWDERQAEGRIKLFLSGSSVSFMENEVLGARSPLFGRRTGQLRLGTMRAWEAGAFFPGLAAQDILSIYGLVGGMPAYLRLFRGRDLWETLRTQAFSRTGFLYDEARFLLMQELRDPRLYLSVLRAIAGGRTSHNEIVQAVGMESRALATYLEPLKELGLVDREVPVTETAPHKSRKGRYRIRDNFFRFAMRFIEPHRSELEAGNAEGVISARLRPQLDDFLGHSFEDTCQEWVRAASAAGRLDFRAERVGRWWSSTEEVDLCALAPGRVLLGECKWSARKVGLDVLRDLERRSLTAFADYPERQLVLFSRSGFTADLIREARGKKVLLMSATELTQAP